MKKTLLFLFSLFIIGWINMTEVSGQVTTNGGSGLAGSYSDLASAITALNGVGTATSPTIITVNTNQTAPLGGYNITATGTAVNTITIQGDATTRMLSAFTPQTAGSVSDAIIKIVGGDYITIQSFTLQENAGNTVTAVATNTMTEFGVALFYASLTNGSQNNTIQNNIISLDRTYRNTFGIYSNTRHSATVPTTSAEVTNATGSNSNNKVYGNTISNINYGIVFIGAGTTIAAIDSGNDIGGNSAITGNTITNWGGGGALTTYISLTTSNYCIFVNQQINDNISYNTITSASLTNGIATGGILKNYTVGQPTGTITTNINNNTVTVTNNPSAVGVNVIGINNQGLNPLLTTATMNINNNLVTGCRVSGSTSTTNGMTGITNLSVPGTLNITGNSVIDHAITATTATTGANIGISNSGAVRTANINNNIVRSLASTATTGQIQGIANSGAVVTALNMNNNQLGNTTSGFFSTSTATSGTLFGITTNAGANTCVLTITGNDIRGITYNVLASSSNNYINQTAATLSQNISNNTFTNLDVNTTGNVTFISNDVALPTGGSLTASGNSIVTAFNKGGAGGIVTLYLTTNTPSSVTTTTKTQQNNNFSNITLTGNTTMNGWMDIEGIGAGLTKNISNNTFTNWTCGSGNVTALQVGYCLGASSISTNTISNITGTGVITGILLLNNNVVIAGVNSNIINGLSSTGTGGAVTAISNACPSVNISLNTINTLSSSSTTATVVGITTSASANIFSNTINTLSRVGTTSGATNGIMVTGGTTHNVYKNKIYNLTTSGAFTNTPGVNGIVLSGAVTSVTANVYNNLIGDLKAPTANSVEAIRGLSITATGTTSNYNIYYNSVFISTTSTGVNFGTSGIFHQSNATATTSALNLRNNIIVNTSTANGTGFTVAHRRADINNANLSTTSNNNLLYAGVPSVSNLILYNSTASYQTLASYQTIVGTRESASVSELPVWQSTTGSSTDFLKYSTSVAILADNGGANISGYTDDFGGTTRNATTPDMGAWELTIIPLLTIVDNGTQPVAGNINQGSINNILQTFTIVEGNRANATLNAVVIPTGANYTASDIQTLGLKLWYNTTNDFATATAFTGVTATASGSGENVTFSTLNYIIPKNTIRYFWVTTDITPSATAGNTINANALAPANTVFALGTPTGTVSAGGIQTILGAMPTISLANGIAPNLTPLQNTTNVILYRVDLTVGVTTAVLNAISFNTSGTYIASDLLNLKIWYHNNTDFTVGTPTQIGLSKTTGLGVGLQTFSSLTQNYLIGTNYLFLTADLKCNSTINNNIAVSAIANTDFTFATGTPTGTGYTSGGTVTINAITLNNPTSVVSTAGNTQIGMAWVNPIGCYDEVMIVVAPATNSGTPSGDGSAYTANLVYNSGTALGNGFVAYKGATSPQTITGLTNLTTYYFKIFTRSGTNWSSGIEVDAMPNAYCTASLHSSSSNQITNVSIAGTTLNSSNGLGAGGYTVVPNTPSSNVASLRQGTAYTATLTIPTCTPTQTALWVDFDRNNTFDTSEYFLVTCSAGTGNATINVPLVASLGTTKMRVRSRTATFANTDACTSFLSGETEDYFITILPPLPRTLGAIATLQATPANTNKNTTNNPIVRIDLPVTEALGTLTLTNLVVTSNNVADADVATNGVKLYYTTTTTFSTANPVGAGQSFSSGLATFSSLTRALASGNNYIWVTYDVATTATLGNTLDAQIAISNMTITEAGGATATGSIPTSALNPVGSVLIIPRNPQALTATAFSNSQINLSTTANADNDNIMVAWNSTNTFGTPTGTYTAGNSIVGGGTVLYVGNVAGLVNHTGLTANTQYFYRVWANGGIAYSTTFQNANATTLPNPLNYVFSQINGTYNEITPTTVLFTNQDDLVSASQTIPSFTYNGVAYTNMFVSTNGFLKLGAATGPGSNVYTPLSTTSTALQNTISAFSNDLGGIDATSVIGWSTVGNEIIVQWKNVRRLGVTGESVNFQIRMNTSTGVINIVYGTCTSGTNTETLQVGIRGFNETWRTQVSNRQGNLDWDKTTMGTNNTSALSMATTNFPASGLTFTYTFNTCTPFPIIGAVTQSGTNVTVNWTPQAEALDGYDVRYRLQSAGIGTYTTVNVPLQPTNNTIISGLSAGTYIFEVRTRCSGSTFSDYSNAIVLNILGDYYLKAGGVVTNMADWGANTDGTGTNPTAPNQALTIWNIRNNPAVNNSVAWTLGTNSKIIVGDGTNVTNFSVSAGSNITGTIDVANAGVLTLQDTANPTLGVLASGSTVDYNGTGNQTIALANYSNLTISGPRLFSPTVTLASGTIQVSNTFSVIATGVGSYVNTGNTIDFNGTGMQTIPAFRYRNITNTGNGNRTLAPSGEVNIAGTFALGTGAYTVTGSTVNYSATTGGAFTMASFNYNNLIFSGSQTFSIGSGNTMNVANDFTISGGTFNVSNGSGTSTLAVTGNANLSGGTFTVSNSSGTGLFSVGSDLNVSGTITRIINSASAPNTTVIVTRDLNISATGAINLESTSSTLGIANINVGRDFNATGTNTSFVNFGTGTITSNAINVARNFSKTNTGLFNTTSGTPLGIVFNGSVGTQTFSYTGTDTQFVRYVVASGSTLQMLTNLRLGTSSLPASTFTVNNGGTLDMGTQVITAGDAIDPLFTLANGGTIKTAQPLGLTANFSGFGASKLVLNSGANYEFNANVAQVTSNFVTTPTANTVNNLTINNTTNTSSTGVTLSTNLNIGGVLNLTSGKLTTGSNTLTLQAGSGAVNPNLGKGNSYVVGNVNITSNTDGQTLLFPMGNGTWWGPAKLVTNGGTGNTTFSVTYNSVSHPFNIQPFPTTPETISTALNAYWDIDRSIGTRNADVSIYWNGNLGQITDRSKLRVLHGGATAWENFGVDNTNGDASDGTTGTNIQGSITKNAVSVFSPFTIGSTDPINPLPISLITFTGIRLNAKENKLQWITATEENNRGFEVERSADGQVFTKIGFVDGANNSSTIRQYSFIDANIATSAYYRLRQVENNSTKATYSNVIFIDAENVVSSIILYPNPTHGEVNIQMSEDIKNLANIRTLVTDIKGNKVIEYTGNWQNTQNLFNKEVPQFANGTYIIRFVTEKRTFTIKLVKE